MADTRLHELLVLASGDDEDVLLQVASELALMPETADERFECVALQAEDIADSYAPPAERVDEETLVDLAEEAGF